MIDRPQAHAGSAAPPRRVPLARLLRAAAADLKTASAPPLQTRLPSVTAVPATASGRAGSLSAGAGWYPPLAWSGALACVLVLVGAGWLMAFEAAPRVSGLAQPTDRAGLRLSGFLPVAPTERWAAGADAEAAWLVSTELPAERLAALGLPYDPGRAGDRVPAELLVHPSGEVLAVRFLR